MPGDVLNIVRRRAKIEPDIEVEDNNMIAANEFSKAAENIDPNQMKSAMEAMDKILDSDLDEYFDETKIEAMRQQLIQSDDKFDNLPPEMIEQAKQASALAADPIKWKQTMMKVKEELQKLKDSRKNIRDKKTPSSKPSDGR